MNTRTKTTAGFQYARNLEGVEVTTAGAGDPGPRPTLNLKESLNHDQP